MNLTKLLWSFVALEISDLLYLSRNNMRVWTTYCLLSIGPLRMTASPVPSSDFTHTVSFSQSNLFRNKRLSCPLNSRKGFVGKYEVATFG
jgi:hypothetical protein